MDSQRPDEGDGVVDGQGDLEASSSEYEDEDTSSRSADEHDAEAAGYVGEGDLKADGPGEDAPAEVDLGQSDGDPRCYTFPVFYTNVSVAEAKVLDTELVNAFSKPLSHSSNFSGPRTTAATDKTVLDMTDTFGMVAMAAARAHAAKVTVLSAKSNHYVHALRNTLKINGFAFDVDVVRGNIRSMHKKGKKFEVIICNWMGECLFNHCWLPDFLSARDLLLEENGVLMPDMAEMFLTAIKDQEGFNRVVGFWSEDVHGFDFTTFRECAASEADLRGMQVEFMVTDSARIKEMDLYEAQVEDMCFSSEEFKLEVRKNQPVHAFLCYYSVSFTSRRWYNLPVQIRDFSTWSRLSTSPQENFPTSLNQTVLFLPEPEPCSVGDVIRGRIKFDFEVLDKFLDMRIHMDWEHVSVKGESKRKARNTWKFY